MEAFLILFLRQARLKSLALSSLLLIPLLLLLTAGGASPLATQIAQVGPYRVLLSFYSLPRVAQSTNMTIGAATSGQQMQFSHIMLKPAPGTDSNIVAVQATPDSDNPHILDLVTTPSVRGNWFLAITINGAAGTVTGNIPIVVAGPPAIPTWLGWLIGLIPLPILLAFFWIQITGRNQQHKTTQHATAL